VAVLIVTLRWAAPAALRRGLHTALAPYGLDATVARAAVGWDTTLRCESVALRDAGGRVWAGAERVDLSLAALFPPGWGVTVEGGWLDTAALPSLAATPGGVAAWLPPPLFIRITLGGGAEPRLRAAARRRDDGYDLVASLAPLRLTGRLRPAAGGLRLDPLAVAGPTGHLAGPLVAAVRADGGRVEVDGPSGPVAGGHLTSHMVLRRAADGSLAYDASVEVVGVDLAPLAPLLPEAARVPTGRLDLQLLASGRGGTLHAGGRLEVTEGDFTHLALTRALLAALGIDDPAPLAHARFDATFEVAGPVVTATMGRIASDLPDLDIALGSRLDLATGDLDAHLTLAAADRLARLPVVGRAAPLLRALTRLHLTGRWDQEAAVVVTRE